MTGYENRNKHLQDNLFKMTTEELMNVVDKDFTELWNSRINHYDDGFTKRKNPNSWSSNSRFPLSILLDGSIMITVNCETFCHECERDMSSIYNNFLVGTRYIIDFNAVKYIDSSGMGLLLMLREYLSTFDKSITIINCCDAVYKLLRCARFNDFFEISKKRQFNIG